MKQIKVYVHGELATTIIKIRTAAGSMDAL
jgi:hypothetical protein